MCFFLCWGDSCCFGFCLSVFTLRFCCMCLLCCRCFWLLFAIVPTFRGCIGLALLVKSGSLRKLVLESTVVVSAVFVSSSLNRINSFFLGYGCILLRYCMLPCVSIFLVVVFVFGFLLVVVLLLLHHFFLLLCFFDCLCLVLLCVVSS